MRTRRLLATEVASCWVLLLLLLLSTAAQAKSPTPWLFKLLEKPAAAAKEEMQSKIVQQTLPFASKRQLRRNRYVFRVAEDDSPKKINGDGVVFVPHDDIIHGGNSASYFLPQSGVWSGRVAGDDDNCFIGIHADHTNWNVQQIDGFQWDILSLVGGTRQLRIVVIDNQGVEWSHSLRLHDGHNQVRTELREFVPDLSGGKENRKPGTSTKGLGPGTIVGFKLLYAKLDERKKRCRNFTPGDFRVKIESIKTF